MILFVRQLFAGCGSRMMFIFSVAFYFPFRFQCSFYDSTSLDDESTARLLVCSFARLSNSVVVKSRSSLWRSAFFFLYILSSPFVGRFL